MKDCSILLVEDDRDSRQLIENRLKNAGYQVSAATTGEEARAIIYRDDFDVIILDAFLPGLSGISVLREVKATKPRIKPIVISLYASLDIAIEAMKLGAIDFLVKPFDLDYLERLIEQSVFMESAEIEVVEEYYAKTLSRLMPPLAGLIEECMKQPGYINGKTLVSNDNESMVLLIGNWKSIEYWKAWETSQMRAELYQFIYPKLVAGPNIRIYQIINQ